MADKSVFNRLKRLFSTDVIIRNVGGDQIKVIDSSAINLKWISINWKEVNHEFDFKLMDT